MRPSLFAVAVVALRLASCTYVGSDRSVDITVPDSAGWTCSVQCAYSGTSQERLYSVTGSCIAWGFSPPGANGDWRRTRGFAMFRLDGVAVPWEEVMSCTLSYYRTDSAAAPAQIRHCWVDVPRTAPDFLYEQGWTGLVAVDSGTGQGWHHVPLSVAGTATVKDYLKNGLWAIGYCWDYPDSLAITASAAGHDSAQRPHLTIVYSDSAR